LGEPGRGKTALSKLRNFAASGKEGSVGCNDHEDHFSKAINEDLNTAKALAITWELIGDDKYPIESRLHSLFKFDKILGLRLNQIKQEVITTLPDVPDKIIISSSQPPTIVVQNLNSSIVARLQNNFSKADAERKKVQEQGYEVQNIPEGFRIIKNIALEDESKNETAE
jgi:cysteinyl-tRNA synthetase